MNSGDLFDVRFLKYNKNYSFYINISSKILPRAVDRNKIKRRMRVIVKDELKNKSNKNKTLLINKFRKDILDIKFEELKYITSKIISIKYNNQKN